MDYEYSKKEEQKKCTLFPYGVNKIKIISIKDIEYFYLDYKSLSGFCRINIVHNCITTTVDILAKHTDAIKQSIDLLRGVSTLSTSSQLAIIYAGFGDNNQYVDDIITHCKSSALEEAIKCMAE